MSKRDKAIRAFDEFEQWLTNEPKQRYDDHAKCALWDAADMLSTLRKKYEL